MSCPQCFTGHVNPGSPVGKFETIHGLRTYVSKPSAGKVTTGIVVIIPDAFGVDFINNQILADHYASAGDLLVYLPDFMNGGAAPVSMMYNLAYLADNNTPWYMMPYYVLATASSLIPHLIRNRFGNAWPRVLSFFNTLRDETNLSIAAAGFCWGGLYSITLTHDTPDTKSKKTGKNLIDCAFAAHPSALTIPGDIEKVALPLSVATGDDDAVLSLSQVHQIEAILKKKESVESEVVIFPGAKHGFSIRASRIAPDSQETKQAEEAENQALAWFKKYLTKP